VYTWPEVLDGATTRLGEETEVALTGGCSLEVAGVKWTVAALWVRLPGARIFYDQIDAAIFTELVWCVLLGGAWLQ
jgi:hypothetical protein